MAATDKTYRNQYRLDIVFAISSLLMLLSTMWMFWQDYYRPYKTEQRLFRDVEEAVAQRVALEQLPDELIDEFEKAEAAVERAKYEVKLRQLSEKELKAEPQRLNGELADITKQLKNATGQERELLEEKKKNLEANKNWLVNKVKGQKQTQLNKLEGFVKQGLTGESLDSLKEQINTILPKKQKAEIAFQDIQAQLISRTSFYDIEVEHHNPHTDAAKRYKAEIKELQKKLEEKKSAQDNEVEALRKVQTKLRFIQAPLMDAQNRLKKVTDDFESQVKTAFNKRWTVWDQIRGLPILDGFADPIKIKQHTLNDVPIDYNFKYVTRFDRCHSCHLGIDQAAFTKDMLKSLSGVSGEQARRLKNAVYMLKRHRAALAGLPEVESIPDPNQMKLKTVALSKEKINQFCAHPRLDLFAHANSKHPAERFGCSVCHGGQGSGTEFSLAAHTPNTYPEMERWLKKSAHGWDRDSQHFWDFPMMPMRFVESSCLKCHHEVTDLISADNRIEAPKLIRGYNLILQNGCFGCHPIAGRKDGRPIGPDLRLEPTPPLEDMTAAERDRLLADPENPPGQLRKVGPSLYRVAEKTNKKWTGKWLLAPRSFRPDTRMPHFYGLSNSNKDVLPDDQKEFPNAEIYAIVHYLFTQSDAYLNELPAMPKSNMTPAEQKKYEQDQQQQDSSLQAQWARANALSIRPPASLTGAEKKELSKLKAAIRVGKAHPKLNPDMPLVKDYQGDAARGRHLFSTKGCLACHRHEGTKTKDAVFKDATGRQLAAPDIDSHAQHGPDLSQIKAKLGKAPGDKSAHVWLSHWIKHPSSHSPRTKMPVVPMTDEEIMDITTWLLDQEATNLGANWQNLNISRPADKTLRELAEVYLVRQLSPDNLKKLRKERHLDAAPLTGLPDDEKDVVEHYNDIEKVKSYVGKKAIGRLGCYACHSIPGFDSAKPIGVGLNDWGKKDPTRLAFEDILTYVKKHYHVVDTMKTTVTKEIDDPSTGTKKYVEMEVPQPFKDGKKPYNHFYFDLLEHHSRIGYLNQKLLEPRSYDYNRMRAWDDRSRMPQFRFARTIRKKGEATEDYKARKWHEEAEARQAVMTFILGLVAEKIPLKSLYRPKGDRLAQVQGRKILQKYNCNGCHMIRPGMYEFKDNRRTMELLTRSSAEDLSNDFNFYNHNAWTGVNRKTLSGRFRAFGVPLRTADTGESRFSIFFDQDEESFPGQKLVPLRLTEALRYYKHVEEKGKDDIKAIDIRAGGGTPLSIAADDFIYPLPAIVKDKAKFVQFEEEYGAFGGTFAHLLTRYLIRHNPDWEAKAFGDNNFARASTPPSLIGQGGRTQPEWLYRFLRNPEPMRKMVVLHMPRFNMSKQEARQLVEYFTAVEHLTNPRFPVMQGATSIPQRAAFDEPYWQKRNEAYVAYLKNNKVEGTDKTLYDQRKEVMTPLWQNAVGRLKIDLETAQNQKTIFEKKIADAEKAVAETKKEKDKTKDEAAKKKLILKEQQQRAQLDGLETSYNSWSNRVKDLEEKKKTTVDDMEKHWRKREAYVLDGFRMLLDTKQLCSKCHQVGPNAPASNEGQGPSLSLAHQRLRPQWIKRWIAQPSRLVSYSSPMPNLFPKNSHAHQQLFAGTSKEQLQALADTLMVYDRVLELPSARDLIYPMIQGDKK